MSGAPDEFRLIADLFAPLSRRCPGALGLTDDAAFLPPPPGGADLVLTMDTMVAGVHFLPDDPPDLVARKLVRVNLSDLAAKGAVPQAVMMSAAFPIGTGMDWLRAFADGLAQDVDRFQLALIGGDTVSTPGPLTLTLTAFGHVAAGRGIVRSGARAGDRIWVSGTIGDGVAGLKAVQGQLAGLDRADLDYLAGRYRLPTPRVELGVRLVGVAHAGMDVSDGLIQDLGHLAAASGVGAVIQAEQVPLSPAAQSAMKCHQMTLAILLSGGDDYEVLFTAPCGADQILRSLSGEIGVTLTPIGVMVTGDKVIVHDHAGQPLNLGQGGWRHFSASGTGAGA